MQKQPFELKYLSRTGWTSPLGINADITLQLVIAESIEILLMPDSSVEEAIFINDLRTRLFRIFFGKQGIEIVLFEALGEEGMKELFDCFKTQPSTHFSNPDAELVNEIFISR